MGEAQAAAPAVASPETQSPSPPEVHIDDTQAYTEGYGNALPSVYDTWRRFKFKREEYRTYRNKLVEFRAEEPYDKRALREILGQI